MTREAGPQRVPPAFVVDAVLRLRRLLLDAADALLPASAVAADRAMGVGRTAVLGTIAELGVADALAEGPRTAADLAAELDVDADALHRVLRFAAADRLLRLDDDGRFALRRTGAALRSDAPGSARDFARYLHLPSTRAAWGDLAQSVRSGRSAFPAVHGTSVWRWFAAHPEEEAIFAGAMGSITAFDAPALAAAKLWPDAGTVCDVAGGAGTLLAHIVAPRPEVRGVLVEAPGVLAAARAVLDRHGVADRVELREGDLFAGRLDARADVYVLKNILHDWDDPTCARILTTVRAAMPPGARLVLIELLQERNAAHPFASLSDVQMLTQCDDGRERSLAELQALLRGAGLEAGRVERSGISALVEGVATG